MKLNLRKANALQQAINDAVSAITITTTLNLTEFSDVARELDDALTLARDNAARRLNLLKALYKIRQQVALMNSTSGIDEVLTAMALNDRLIKEATVLAQAPVRQDVDVITSRVAKLKEIKPSDGYYHENTIQTGVITRQLFDDSRDMILTLKRNKQQLADQLLELNVTNSITLDDDTLAVLKKEKLV